MLREKLFPTNDGAVLEEYRVWSWFNSADIGPHISNTNCYCLGYTPVLGVMLKILFVRRVTSLDCRNHTTIPGSRGMMPSRYVLGLASSDTYTKITAYCSVDPSYIIKELLASAN